MSEAEKYVRRFLKTELEEVSTSPIAGVRLPLSLFERVLIYKYTADGYQSLNRSLRKSRGKLTTKFGTLLAAALRKMPAFGGLVYRSVWLTGKQLQNYIDHAASGLTITEPAFISTTKRVETVENLGKWNCLFHIRSRTGREIEVVSKLGSHTDSNEAEVLFLPGQSFKVLSVTKEADYMLIKMKEL